MLQLNMFAWVTWLSMVFLRLAVAAGYTLYSFAGILYCVLTGKVPEPPFVKKDVHGLANWLLDTSANKCKFVPFPTESLQEMNTLSQTAALAVKSAEVNETVLEPELATANQVGQTTSSQAASNGGILHVERDPAHTQLTSGRSMTKDTTLGSTAPLATSTADLQGASSTRVTDSEEKEETRTLKNPSTSSFVLHEDKAVLPSPNAEGAKATERDTVSTGAHRADFVTLDHRQNSRTAAAKTLPTVNSERLDNNSYAAKLASPVLARTAASGVREGAEPDAMTPESIREALEAIKNLRPLYPSVSAKSRRAAEDQKYLVE